MNLPSRSATGWVIGFTVLTTLVGCTAGTDGAPPSTTSIRPMIDKSVYVSKANAVCEVLKKSFQTIPPDPILVKMTPLTSEPEAPDVVAANESFKRQVEPMVIKARDDLRSLGTPSQDPAIGAQVDAKFTKLLADIQTIGYRATVGSTTLNDQGLRDYGLTTCFDPVVSVPSL